eukprot:UN01447
MILVLFDMLRRIPLDINVSQSSPEEFLQHLLDNNDTSSTTTNNNTSSTTTTNDNTSSTTTTNNNTSSTTNQYCTSSTNSRRLQFHTQGAIQGAALQKLQQQIINDLINQHREKLYAFMQQHFPGGQMSAPFVEFIDYFADVPTASCGIYIYYKDRFFYVGLTINSVLASI